MRRVGTETEQRGSGKKRVKEKEGRVTFLLPVRPPLTPPAPVSHTIKSYP